MSEQNDKFYLHAQKNATRARHQLIMQLAKIGKTREEINGVIMLIDWQKEIDWAAEEFREADKKQSIPIPPPATPGANVETPPS